MRGLAPSKRAERRETVAALAGLPTLIGCGRAELDRLARCGTVVTVPAGWALIQEHTPGDACYVILSGDAGVMSHGAEIAALGPGALVGEVGLLDARLRTATVVSRTPMQLLSVGFDAMQRLLRDEPHLADALLADYRRRTAQEQLRH